MCTSCEALTAENEALMERYQIVESGRYAAERQVRYLKGQLNGSTTPETKNIKAVCEYHDECWHRVFPRAKGLRYPMDGKNAGAVRKVLRWGFKVEQIKEILDGAFASDFHRTKPQYLYLSSVLGDENKIRNHLERLAEQQQAEADRLIDEGLKQVSQALKVPIEDPIDRVLRALESQDLEWRASRWGDPDFAVNLWHARCPACMGSLTVTVNENRAHPACGSCDEARVLVSLGLVPEDLTRRFVPGVPEPQPAKVRHLPPLGSPVLFEMAEAA